MTAYAPDTSATAVVLYSKCDVRYDLLANNFRILYNYEVKIKVLKSEGASYADIQIPYYSNGRNPTLKENVSQLALFLDFRKQVAKQFNNKIIIKRI